MVVKVMVSLDESAKTLPPVLVVEDDEDDRFFLFRRLREMGVHREVIAFATGAEAVKFLTTAIDAAAWHQLPCVLITDFRGPVESNMGLVQWCRYQPALRSLYIVVLTGSESPTDQQEAKTAGADHYVMKTTNLKLPAEIVRLTKDC